MAQYVSFPHCRMAGFSIVNTSSAQNQIKGIVYLFVWGGFILDSHGNLIYTVL